jgi:hypothetical protein
MPSCGAKPGRAFPLKKLYVNFVELDGGATLRPPMDVSLLKLKSIFRQAAGKKGTLLAQALRKRNGHDAKCAPATVPEPSETTREPAGEPVRDRERAP